jgi:hypothetical protein
MIKNGIDGVGPKLDKAHILDRAALKLAGGLLAFTQHRRMSGEWNPVQASNLMRRTI